MARRSGSPTSFWNNAVTGASGVSNVVEVAKETDQIALFVTVGGATTISIETAHSGGPDADGEYPDANAGNWGQLYYIDSALQIAFGSAGSVSWIIPDFEPGWIRLRSSNSVTATAGHEATSG